MNIQLIQGRFNAKDSIDIITQMIQVKVKYHEQKISEASNEEDIKRRESKIKSLQKDLFDLRENLAAYNNAINIEAVIRLEK